MTTTNNTSTNKTKNVNKAISLLALLFINLLFTSTSYAWWNDEWTFRKKLVIDTTPTTGINLQDSAKDVPVLVRLHTGNFGYFLDLKQDGSDLRFIGSDDKTPLKYHIEKFDPINQMAFIWVLVPQVMGLSGTEFVWMYYGNANAVNGADGEGSFGINQTLDYHFNGDGTAPKDVTAYKNNPVLYTAESLPASFIGAGAAFKGQSIINLPDTPTLKVMPESGWTAAMWVKISEAQNNADLLHRKDGRQELTLSVNQDVLLASYTGADGAAHEVKGPSLPLGNWQHVALSLGGGQLVLYVNGNEVGRTAVTVSEMGGPISIGNSETGGNNAFTGEIDELTLAKVARSPAWLKTVYGSQGVDAKLLKYGDDEQSQSSGNSGSYIQILLQNVTIDGWVVIVILSIMAAISWVVMLGKGLLIAKVKKDNRAFLEQFRKLDVESTDKLDTEESQEDTELDQSPLSQALFGKHDHFQSSPIYKLYHLGVQQVHFRIGSTVGAQASNLSPNAMNAIRAALDADLVRHMQKLNSQMVLLTIAISGGPFLGLLGTVVGVMITFAAIAASGDVNINAIAPGIAAALVATVAGLAVAIPALFGYNYLGSQIKEAIADMHVFVDEFITRVAEYYGR